MLSTAAFNALLKSLEEPPPNTIFILATTEPHKIPDTVISRCQRHDFRALGQREIVDRLQDIAKQEGLEVEDEAVLMVARLADGSMRDAQSLFDRVRSFCSGSLTAEEAGVALGTVNRQVLSQLSQSIFERQPDKSLEIVDRAFSTGIDPGLFLKEFVSHWRTLLVAGFGTNAMLLEFGASQDEVKEFAALIEAVDKNDLQDLVRLAREGAEEASRSQYPRYALEALVVRMATRLPVKDLGELLGKMRSIIRGGAKAARQPGKQQGPEKRPYALQENSPTAKKEPLLSQDSLSEEATPSEPDHVRYANEMPSVDMVLESASEPPPAPPEEPKPEVPRAKPLSWERFVIKGCKSVSPIMLQHLKRLHAKTFTSGVLELVGPPLSLVYFREKENADKLHRLLESFYKADSWQLTLSESEVDSVTLEPGSLLHEQKKSELEKLQKTRDRLEKHPSVKKFKEVFPGSSIESVRLKQ
jgi:DNA polymerase-3 subunit gamma/tau